MEKSTLLKKYKEMFRKPLEHCHGGKGSVDWTNVLSSKELNGRAINFFHNTILPPGVSIGVHQHTEDEEYYYILSGKGVMTLNDESIEVGPGDITAVFPGGMHGLENTGDKDLQIIVISIKVNSDKHKAEG